MIEKKCENCRAYENGRCHLNPPQVTVHKPTPSIMIKDPTTVFHSSFPEVFKWDWCMKFEAKETFENLGNEL